MNRTFAAAVLAVGVLIPANSDAWVFQGNPGLSIWVDRSLNDLDSAEVTIDSVRVHKCAGGYNSYDVDQTLDLTGTLTVTIDAGDYCGVSVQYGTTMRIEQTGSAGFVVDYEEANTSIELDDASGTGSSALLPLDVIQGPAGGGAPRLYVDIN